MSNYVAIVCLLVYIMDIYINILQLSLFIRMPVPASNKIRSDRMTALNVEETIINIVEKNITCQLNYVREVDREPKEEGADSNCKKNRLYCDNVHLQIRSPCASWCSFRN
jgi:hypothetical protein